MKLICGIDHNVRGAELLGYNKNSEKTSKIKRPSYLIVPLEMDSLENTEQSRGNCIEPTSEYNRPKREAAKNADMKRRLNDISSSDLAMGPECVKFDWIIKQCDILFRCSITYHMASL